MRVLWGGQGSPSLLPPPRKMKKHQRVRSTMFPWRWRLCKDVCKGELLGGKGLASEVGGWGPPGAGVVGFPALLLSLPCGFPRPPWPWPCPAPPGVGRRRRWERGWTEWGHGRVYILHQAVAPTLMRSQVRGPGRLTSSSGHKISPGKPHLGIPGPPGPLRKAWVACHQLPGLQHRQLERWETIQSQAVQQLLLGMAWRLQGHLQCQQYHIWLP